MGPSVLQVNWQKLPTAKDCRGAGLWTCVADSRRRCERSISTSSRKVSPRSVQELPSACADITFALQVFVPSGDMLVACRREPIRSTADSRRNTQLLQGDGQKPAR